MKTELKKLILKIKEFTYKIKGSIKKLPQMDKILSKLKALFPKINKFIPKTPLFRMLAFTGLLFGPIFAYKILEFIIMKHYFATMLAPIVTVSAEKLTYQPWQPKLRASGTVRAPLGIELTTEVSGLVRNVLFKSGDSVKKGDILIELNADADLAHLQSLKALAKLAELSFIRSKEQYMVKAIGKAALDAAEADFKCKEAQVDEQQNILAKKTIRAPFSGKLGITSINPGEFVNPGDKIVTLQMLDPIYVDFFLPQKFIAKLKAGQNITIFSESFPEKIFKGTVTAIDPKIKSNTRNVHLQASLTNQEQNLLPGMFVSVEMNVGETVKHLTLPQAAISYNPYGELVYVINETGKNKNNQPILTVRETFITVGETRGDQVNILKGLKEGDIIVTSGQMKLRNGSQVVINNSVVPSNDPDPQPIDE